MSPPAGANGRQGRGSRSQFSRRQLVLLSVLLTWVAMELAAIRPFPVEFERSEWQGLPGLSLQSEVRGLVSHAYFEDKLYATRTDELFVSGDTGQSWSLLGQLEPRDYSRAESWGRSLRRSRLGRAFWPGRHPTGVLPLPSGGVIALHPPWIQRSYDGGRNWGRVYEIGLESPPGNNLVREPSGRLWAASGRLPSHLIFSDDDGKTWEELALRSQKQDKEMEPPGPVTSIQLDPLRGRVWLTTGGAKAQVQIGWLEPEGDFRPIAVGKDEYRAGSLMFTSEYVYWASDAPMGPGGVWRWTRIDEQIENVAKLPGPVRNSTILADGSLLVATRVDSPGTQDLEILGSDDGVDWTSLLRTRASDSHSRGGLATAVFVEGEAPPNLVFSVDGFGAIRPSTIIADWVR
jgi:hypothetical protein